MFRSQVVADSISPVGHRLTTFRVECPRFILAEINTHKMVCRSAASSRATPVESMLARLVGAPETDKSPKVEADPFVPLEWGLNESGMQARKVADEETAQIGRDIWREGMEDAVRTARSLHAYEFHKQLVNRVVEPYCWTRVVLTATEWANFFALRTHIDAEPHFRHLARCMYVAYQRSIPKRLDYGQWHLPFVAENEQQYHLTGTSIIPGLYGWEVLCRLSAARCARVSYAMHERKKVPSAGEDIGLFDRFVGGFPKHMGPLEHQGRPWEGLREYPNSAMPESLRSPLRGYVQFRKEVVGENIATFDPSGYEVAGWGVPESAMAPWGDER